MLLQYGNGNGIMTTPHRPHAKLSLVQSHVSAITWHIAIAIAMAMLQQ
jgi:hypothetical protein